MVDPEKVIRRDSPQELAFEQASREVYGSRDEQLRRALQNRPEPTSEDFFHRLGEIARERARTPRPIRPASGKIAPRDW